MVALAGRLEGGPEFRAERLTVPVYLFGEMDNAPGFRAAFRLQKELAGAVEADPAFRAGLRVARGLAGALAADLELSALLGWPVDLAGEVAADAAFLAAFGSDAPELAGAIAAEAEFRAAVLVPFRVFGTVEASPEFRASFGFAFPEVGVVNLAPNPSVEHGLDGWGGDVARVADAAGSWSGAAHVEWVVAAGGAGAVEVASVAGLQQAGGSWSAGVAMDLPSGAVVTPIVRLLYADGSFDETQPETFEEYDDDGNALGAVVRYGTFAGEGLGWRRYQATALAADPAKTLDRVALSLGIDNADGTAPVVVRLDGAQVARFGPGHDVYVDGDQPGARWLGPAHASASVGGGA